MHRLHIKQTGQLTLMTLPGLLFIFCFAYLPMFGVIIAFKRYKYSDGILGSKWVGFENFKFLVSSGDAWRITYNTVFLNILFIIFGTAAAVILALLMNEVRNKWPMRFFQSSLFIPHMLSWVVVAYIIRAFLDYDIGYVNSILDWFQIGRVQWYMRPADWPLILVLTNIWKNAGFSSVIYLAAMLAINKEFYEAAKIDGASKLQQIKYITLPLITPLITILLLLSIGRIFYADLGLFYYVTNNSGSLYSTTDVIDTYVVRMLRAVGDTGMASAAGFYQSIVGFILVVLSNWIVRKIDSEKSLF